MLMAAAVEAYSFWFDRGRFDDRPPFLGIGFHKCPECLRRLLITRKQLISKFNELRLHRRIRKCFHGRCIKLADTGRWRAFGREKPEPARERK